MTDLELRAHPAFAALVKGFLESRRRDVLELRAALDRGDLATVERLGHGMKGAGGSYGFQAITDIGAALEQAARRADAEAIRRGAGELLRLLDAQ